MIKNKYGLKAAVSIAAGFSPLILSASDRQKPNIVFLFADQLRADVLGYAGDPKAYTPNIDSFARHAVNFTEAVSVCPVSAPYRSSLLTGKYISSTGMVINEINMNLNHRTIADVLNDNGYRCGYVGKMHLNDAHARAIKKGRERLGFNDYFAGYSFNHMSYDSFYYTDDENGNETRVSLKGKYGPEEFTTLACNYIEKAAAGEKPFCLFLSWNPTHDPWKESNTDPDCYARFKDTVFSLPENFKENPDPYMDRFPQEFFDGKTRWKDNFLHGEGYQKMMRAYYAMATSVDEQFGRVMQCLKDAGIEDNTIVIFTSDHGEMFTSQGRMFKLTFYDEASKVPLLIKMPGGTSGCDDALINTPDIMPTILGMAGLGKEIPAETEGRDLSFIIKGRNGKRPESAFQQGMGHTYQWKDGYEWRSVRTHKYLYARYLKDGHEVLIDRTADPEQINNVASDERYCRQLKKMRKKMELMMKDLGDDFMPCTWYKENWMYKGFSIKAAANGDFGPIPPMEPRRKQK